MFNRPKKSGSHRTRARVKIFLKRWARAHSEKYLLTFAKRAGGPPAPWGGGPCARARARALSTRDFQNSHFLLYNFWNNQGKSCSASWVWQVCQSSARSEPISKSYDQNNIYKGFLLQNKRFSLWIHIIWFLKIKWKIYFKNSIRRNPEKSCKKFFEPKNHA